MIALQEGVIRNLEHAKHTVVPDSGHYIHVDRPDLIIDSVHRLMAQGRALACGCSG